MLLIFSILFFILTRETYVYIIFEKGLRLEFHLVLFSLILTEREGEKGQTKLKFRFYSSLAKRILRLSEKSCINVKRIYPAKLNSLLSPEKIVKPYFYNALISGLLAYFFGKSKRITMEDNALVLIPDKNDGSIVDIRVSSELYNILTALALILFDFQKYKRKGKRKNVGN